MGKYFNGPLFLLLHRKSDRRSPEELVALPPEILDKILGYVPTNGSGRQTLVACALVATWWTGLSQRRLFSSVEIGERNYQRWMDGVALSGSKTHLLDYVRSLAYCLHYRHRMRDLAQYSGEYFPGLRNLHSLSLFKIVLKNDGEEYLRTCFSTFRETLTSLSLDTFSMSFSAFVTLIDYFPKITTLRLHWFGLEPDGGPARPLSRPLRGRFHVQVRADFPKFLDRFSELNLKYEELVIEGPFSSPAETELVESALRISPSTVKHLKLIDELQRE